ncbi:MAG: enoyl-CoA hydratase-related protein [Actinomycetota bacterium]
MGAPPRTLTVDLEQHGRVALIALNRPEARNAWNGELNRDLDTALRWAAGDDDIGAIVLTGRGRTFCAGADLSSGGEAFRGADERGPDDDRESRTPTLLPWQVPKPVICALNGHAVGVGATYALVCDVRLMAPEAKIGFVFSRRGMLSELGSHAVLPRVVGLSNAADLLLSGRAVTAAEAAAMGLVSAVVDGDDLVGEAIGRAQDMAVNGAPVSMALSKRLLWESMGVAEMARREDPLFDWIAEQADSVEGVSSFLDKREPDWKLSVTDDFPHHLFGGT